MHTAVTVEQSRLLCKAISDLVVQTEAGEAYLTDCSGNVIAQTSGHDSSAVQSIAALSAGAFAATRQLAGLLGESMFQSVLHQGHDSHLYMQSLASQFLVLVVFGRNTTVGLVKLYVKKMSAEIELLLQEMSRQSTAAAGASREAFEIDNSGAAFDVPARPR